MGGNQATGDHGLASTGRSDKHTEVMTDEGVARCLLVGIEFGLESEVVSLTGCCFVDDLKSDCQPA